MTTTTPTKIPAPLYAVAGVGELAYRRLRRLPTDLERLPLFAAALRTEIPTAVGTVVARAQDVYHELVARGEAAVASPRTEHGPQSAARTSSTTRPAPVTRPAPAAKQARAAKPAPAAKSAPAGRPNRRPRRVAA